MSIESHIQDSLFENNRHDAMKLSASPPYVKNSFHNKTNGDSPPPPPPPNGSSSSSSSSPLLNNGGTTRPSRKSVLQRLSEALLRRSLTKIDLSQRGLRPADARLVKMALVQNSHVRVLKLGYNHLGDEGVEILASGIAEHVHLESLDLGFNHVGDEGCRKLAQAIRPDGRLHTLYLAGNLIGEDGAMAIADLMRRKCCLQKLYLTGNRLGPSGVKAITEAILEDELEHHRQEATSDNGDDETMSSGSSGGENNSAEGSTASSWVGIQELFLGGTGIGPSGCEAVARLLEKTSYLRTLSLPNCDIGDEAVAVLAASIKSNRDRLPLESLQLSFNRISYRGTEALANALWGSRTLKELLLDNNDIGDGGAQLVASVIPSLRKLETLDVGFNRIKTAGIKVLMKAVAETTGSLQSLSVSGNTIDTTAAKYIAYALAHNSSLVSVNLVHSSIVSEGKRQIVAGIVSNTQTRLREVRGFSIGPIVVNLGFPAPMEHWNNEQVLNFIHVMWDRPPGIDVAVATEEETLDPLHFLPAPNENTNSTSEKQKPAPVEASVVIETAKKAFQSLVEEGVDVFSRRPGHKNNEPWSLPPIAEDGNVFINQELEYDSPSESSLEPLPNQQNQSFVAPPEESAKSVLPDPTRKKRIVEWLCSNIQHLNKLAQKPFSSTELWQLHQHYFTPVVNESGGSVAPSPNPSVVNPFAGGLVSSFPEVSRGSSSDYPVGDANSDSTEDSPTVPVSDPTMQVLPPLAYASLPMLKRKVSYRFLGDAALAAAAPENELRAANVCSEQDASVSVSMLIEGGPTGHSMPPKTKRARRNRARISFLPRIKAKLDSCLDTCHEKALVTMRQLCYVEQAILSGQVNPIDPTTASRTHLCGDFATDAEMIVVDMI